jgi:soluble lytic murein transglycosylase-like protein
LPQVLALVPPELHSAIRANLGAGQELGVLNEPVAAIPHWRIVTPPPPDELLGYYAEAERIFGVSWAYLAAINLVETNMGRIQGLSSAGAQGPMQFIPSTWAIYGRGDVNNPHDAILAAARYLKAAGAPGNMPRALYAYNPSQLYVRIITNYAQQMLANERAFLGYYYWQVHVETNHGDVLLEEGYVN